MSFTFQQKVLFKHCDPARIAFYPRMFEIINDCIEDFFCREILYPFESMSDTGVPTAAIEVRFAVPCRHGEDLTLTLDVTRIGRTSLGLAIRAEVGAEPRFAGTQTLVHVNRDGRPSAWPAPVRERL